VDEGDGLAVVAVAVGVGAGSETGGDHVGAAVGVGLAAGDTVAGDTVAGDIGQVVFAVSESLGLAVSVAPAVSAGSADWAGLVDRAGGVVAGAWVSAAVGSSSVDRTAVGAASAVAVTHVSACVDLAAADRATPGTMLTAARPGARVVAKFATLLPRVCVPLLSVPPPPSGACEPPSNTVELAAMMACRNGCTPSEMAAMAAMPASTAPSLSPALVSPAPLSPGHGTSRPRGAGKAAGHRSEDGHAQRSLKAQRPP
jgi:hypothetical protein